MVLTSSRRLQNPLSGLILAYSFLACTAGEAGAQARVGIGKASLSIPVQMTIRPRLRLSAPAAPEVVERTTDVVELEFTFVVAANVDWSMTVALPADAAVHSTPTVRTATGAWAPLARGSELRVIGRMAPSNGELVRVRVRLPAAEGERLSRILRFTANYADGLSGG